MKKRDNSLERRIVVLIALAACCALALTGCSGSGDSDDSTEPVELAVPGDGGAPVVDPNPEDPVVPMPPEAVEPDVPGDAAAPVVVLTAEDWVLPMPSEADILADRLLRSEDDGLILDAAERSLLAAEIGSVLFSIREAFPAFADIRARTSYAFGVLLVGLEPQLFEAIASLLEDQTGPVTLQTGYAEFDTLNATLGLSAVVNLFSSFHGAVFFFDEHLNVPAAAAAYEMVEGVRYAEPDAGVGDGSDLAVTESEGRWYVVARRASGDCPSGCIYEELFFFAVDETAVEMIDSEQALQMAEFMDLVMSRGW